MLLGFGLLFLMFAGIALISWRSTRSFMRTAERVAHAHESLELLEQTKRHLMEMESAGSAFLLTGNEALIERSTVAQQRTLTDLAELERRLSFASKPPGVLAELRILLHRAGEQQRAESEARRAQGAEAAAALFAADLKEDLVGQMKRLLDSLEAEQRRALSERAELTGEIAHGTTLAIAAGGLLTFAALFFACSMILRDIAARRRAEQSLAAEHNLLSSIMDTMPNHVFLKDAKGRFILDNASHRLHLGLEEDESIEGRTVAEFYDPAAAEHFQEADRQVIETGEPIINRQELVKRQPTGQERWLETTKVPLRDTDGRIVGLVGISSDITARKNAEEQLRRFAGQLERSNVELQNFASVASHDLQEPLRKIQAFGDRLKVKCGEALGEKGRDYLDRMQNAAQRMQILIQDLLTLSRITSRAQPFETCNLNEILTGVLSDLEVAIERQGARVQVGALPVIEADPLQIRQLFQNLISNGLKFHQPGTPPAVSISGRLIEPEVASVAGRKAPEATCEIVVQDEGIGFDPKFAEQIFVVFQRLHTRSEFEGTGIGLAVCRKITDRHGGTIVATSEEGHGARFIITLPVKQSSAQT